MRTATMEATTQSGSVGRLEHRLRRAIAQEYLEKLPAELGLRPFAALVGLSPGYVRVAVAKGEIVGHRVGATWVIPLGPNLDLLATRTLWMTASDRYGRTPLERLPNPSTPMLPDDAEEALERISRTRGLTRVEAIAEALVVYARHLESPDAAPPTSLP